MVRRESSMFICPHCNKRVSRMPHTGDIVHDCADFDTSTDANEDVLILGDWEDFDGSGTRTAQEVMRQGTQNELMGTRAWLEGEDKEDLTVRGNPKDRYRTRRHFQHIDV